MKKDLIFKGNYRLVRFGGEERPNETAQSHLKQMIKECEDLYPGIEIWYNKKVEPGIVIGERDAILIYDDEVPIGSAVVRKGKNAKLCSLRIDPQHQKRGVGRLIMTLVGLELRHERPKNIHFTIPENLWIVFEEFFNDYGFKSHGPASRQYRLFDQELACSVNYEQFWKRVIETQVELEIENQLFNNQSLPDILLSIQPQYMTKILNGEKRVEIRRKFPKRWQGARVVFYASRYLQELTGEATIKEVESADPKSIWDRYGDEIGCTFEEYINYCGDKDKVSAIQFYDVLPYRYKLPKIQLEHLVRSELKPPQSYGILDNNKDWSAAIAIGSILRTCY